MEKLLLEEEFKAWVESVDEAAFEDVPLAFRAYGAMVCSFSSLAVRGK